MATPVDQSQETSEVDRLCVSCKHFEIDFGYIGEGGDLGGAGGVECREKKFDEYEPTESEFYRIIRLARTCDKFERRPSDQG